MPVEIERKFLLANEDWRQEVSRSVRLRDGILACFDGRKIRVRFYNEKATLTVKGPRKGHTRDEFEYEIPSSDGLQLLQSHCKGEILEKTRHHILIGGHEWMVDEFHGILDGIFLAEVELPSEDTELSPPTWVGQEVTHMEKYRQAKMLKARKKKIADAARRSGKRNGVK